MRLAFQTDSELLTLIGSAVTWFSMMERSVRDLCEKFAIESSSATDASAIHILIVETPLPPLVNMIGAIKQLTEREQRLLSTVLKLNEQRNDLLHATIVPWGYVDKKIDIVYLRQRVDRLKGLVFKSTFKQREKIEQFAQQCRVLWLELFVWEDMGIEPDEWETL